MAQRILRTLDYGGIIDELFDLYKKNFLVLAGIAGILYIPIYVLAFALGGKDASLITTFLILPVQLVVMAATTWAVSRIYLGESVTIADAYKAVWRRAFMLFWTLFLAGLFIYLGLIACIVPGVILMFRYAFISEVFVLEGLSGKDARVRSASLADGNQLRIFVLGLLSTLLAVIITGALTFPFETDMWQNAMKGVQTSPGVLYGVMQSLAATLTSPIQVMAFVLLYYDIRIRKEGFDIEMLANNMKASAVQSPISQ